MTASDGVREYYDANTRKFLIATSQRAIHRELWGPGVSGRSEAVHQAHALVLDQLDRLDQPDVLDRPNRRVLDLGCGVGSAALYLAGRRPVDVIGVSLSPEQIRLAERYAAGSGTLRGSVAFEVADFTALPDGLTDFDLAFAIESFVHADPAGAFFGQAARALRPGGVLVVIDDVLTSASDDPRLEDFRAGWHVSSLLTVADTASLAAAAGLDLVGSMDLSAQQRLGRPRDRLIHLAQPALRRLRGRSAWADALVGGHALQQSHRAGLLEYRMLRFVRRSG